MLRSLLTLSFVLAVVSLSRADVKPPLQAAEAKVFLDLIAVEKYSVAVAEMPGFAKSGIVKQLEQFGYPTKTLQSWGVVNQDKAGLGFYCLHTLEGRVVALWGNGAWLRNDSLRALAALPELRVLRVDHNGVVNKPEAEWYDGSGLEALANSQLLDLRLGLSFNDKGMEQAAKIKSLRSFITFHGRATEAGVKYFERHPNLEVFSIGNMGSDKVTQRVFATLATLPKLTHVGYKEGFASYVGGFEHLAPLKGRLKEIDLTNSLVLPADREKLQADHPQATIKTTAAPDLAKNAYTTNRLLKWASPEAVAWYREQTAGKK